jgi:hypothetical protein
LSQLYPEARHFSLHGSSGLLQAQFRDTFDSFSTSPIRVAGIRCSSK